MIDADLYWFTWILLLKISFYSVWSTHMFLRRTPPRPYFMDLVNIVEQQDRLQHLNMTTSGHNALEWYGIQDLGAYETSLGVRKIRPQHPSHLHFCWFTTNFEYFDGIWPFYPVLLVKLPRFCCLTRHFCPSPTSSQASFRAFCFSCDGTSIDDRPVPGRRPNMWQTSNCLAHIPSGKLT